MSIDNGCNLYKNCGTCDYEDCRVVKLQNTIKKEKLKIWAKAYNQASKETAEKILFKFESAFAYYDNEDMFSKKAIFECLEEIVTSCGVEIKE